MLGTSLIILFVLAFNSLLQETRNIKTAVANNVKRACEVVNGLPGFCCQPVQGGAFAFPRLYLPPKAIQKAKVTALSRSKCTPETQSLKSLIILHLISGDGNATRYVLLSQTTRGDWCVCQSWL